MNARRSNGKEGEFTPLGQVLAGVLRSMGLEKRLQERQLVEEWPALAGPDLARFSRALRVQKGILYLKVESSAWGQELQFLKPVILERVNERFGSGLIQDIRMTGR